MLYANISTQMFTQEVIDTLQIFDTSVLLDPMRTFNKTIGLCENELRQQRFPLQDPFNFFLFHQVDYINTQKYI